MLLLKYNTTKKKQVDENTTQLEFEAGNKYKYNVERICNRIIHAKELKAGHLPGFYYLVSWKNYPNDKNT